MCDKCSQIDYPIGDPIWLPCGGPASRYSARKKPMAFSEADTHIQQKISHTIQFVQQQQQQSSRKGKGFEGLLE
jgi:hypothetical protein